MPRLVDVALPIPLFRTFSYAIGEEVPAVLPGTRVIVPLRGRREVGIVVGERHEAEAQHAYKDVLGFPDASPAVPPALFSTLEWIARHYAVSFGSALRAALPVLLTSASAPNPGDKRERVAVLSRRLDSLMERDEVFRRSARQREVYELLEALRDEAPVRTLREQLGVSDGVIGALAKRGFIRLESRSTLRDPFAGRPTGPSPVHEPTPMQRAVIDGLASAAPGTVALLHGVTGSGKTLVYLELLRQLLAEPHASAIVLVPEIALTPQTVGRFRSVFGDQVAVLHSGLSDGERLDAWRVLHRGERRIAVGARSAIFAPLQNVRAIIVDEEHEATYKQNESPRYSARDVAMVRGRLEGAVVVLGSATPSLESWTNAREGKFVLHSLMDRVGGGTLPQVEIIDVRGPRRPVPSETPGVRVPAPPQMPTILDPFRRVISERLERALQECVARDEQAILLLNRRGYASFLQCVSCGDVRACPNCSISLTYHRTPERLTCHYCAHQEMPPERCVRCGADTVRQKGLGTQQVERLLGDRMPKLRIARMDMDTTTGKWAHADILDRVGRHEVDVLLGTQMIAKGLDFANVTLVGVIDADVGLNLPDFRASERTFQLLAQVAGRAGRGEKPGQVVVQTRTPDHHAIQCAIHHDFIGFAARELADRESPPYPPTVRLANVVVSGLDEAEVAKASQAVSEWLKRLVEARAIEGLRLIGPAPCAIDRIKQRWRWHLLLKSGNTGQLTKLLLYLAQRFKMPDRAGLRLTIDRDPASLL